MKRRFIKTSKKTLAIALAAVMAMPTVMANPVEAEASVTDYGNPNYLYEFDGNYSNSGTAGSATASVVGGGSIVTDSERGQVFDNCSGTASAKGVNYVQLPDAFATDLKDETAMTVGMWIKSPEANNSVANNGAFGGGWGPVFTMNNSAADWNWTVMTLRGTVHANINGYFDNAATNAYSGYLGDNEWHYVAFTVTTTATNTYIDGELLNTLTRTDAATVFTDVYDVVAIGGNQCHLWPDGDIHVYYDDVSIWFKEMSASAIKTIYEGGTLAPISGISAEDTTVAAGSLVTPVVTYTPSTTADVGYSLSTTDTDIVSVVGAQLMGIKAGTATVTVTSTANPSISNTFNVTVTDKEWSKNTASTFTCADYLGAGSGYEKLVGNFDITYTFNSAAAKTDFNDRGFLVEIKDTSNKSNIYRSDAWHASANLGDVSWTSDMKWGDQFADWLAAIPDMDVTVNIKRNDSTLVVSFTMEDATGVTRTATATTTNESLDDILFVQLTANAATISNIELTSLVQTIGAQTKENDNSVLGFITTIDKDAFAAIGGTDKGTKNDLKMGILVKNSAHPTEDAMVLENVGAEIKQIETNYVATLATLDPTNHSNDTDTYAFRSVITGITDTAKEYTAVAYVTYTVDDVTYTVYGPEITRSVEDVIN